MNKNGVVQLLPLPFAWVRAEALPRVRYGVLYALAEDVRTRLDNWSVHVIPPVRLRLLDELVDA